MRSLGLKGSPLQWQEIATSQTLGSGYGYLVTASSNITLTLPVNPAIGATVAITVLGAGDVTIALNGTKWQGYSNDRLIKGRAKKLVLVAVYSGESQGWMPNNADIAPMAGWAKFIRWFSCQEPRQNITPLSTYLISSVGTAILNELSSITACPKNALMPGSNRLCTQFIRANRHRYSAAHTTDLAITTDDLDIVAVATTDTLSYGAGNYGFIASKDAITAGNRCWNLIFDGDNSSRISFSTVNSGGTLVATAWSSNPLTATSYFIRAFRSGTVQSLSVNQGTPVTAVVSGALNSSTSAPLEIGGNNAVGITSYLNGNIMNLGIASPVRLTDEEAAEIYNGGSGRWLGYPPLWSSY